MQFTIDKESLTKALTIVLKGINAHFTIPIYSCVLIETRENQIVLSTASTETFITTVCAANIEEAGSVAIPAKYFSDLVRSMPDNAIHVESQDNQNFAKMTCGNGHYTINALQADDFPSFPEVAPTSQVILPAQTVGQMVKAVAYALSNSNARPVLTGILVNIESGVLTMVATDSYRVAKISTPIENNDTTKFEVIVPGSVFKDVVAASSSIGDMTLGYSDNQMLFSFGDTTFVTRRIEGNYPNFKAFFPTEFSTTFTVNTEEFISALKRLRILINASPVKNSPVVYKVSAEDQSVTLSASYVDLGEGIENVPATVDGESLTISFNSGYVLDGISSVITEELRGSFTGGNKPGIFSCTRPNEMSITFDYLVMPVNQK